MMLCKHPLNIKIILSKFRSNFTPLKSDSQIMNITLPYVLENATVILCLIKGNG